ncbi:MAG TPA: ABC transporter permease [Dehalococcoidia bacterium]|nr:ABC transporter permease [Dehalococcoidia bacterium]
MRRLLWLGPALLFISMMTFGLMHNVRGGPWDGERPLQQTQIDNLNRKYGLDEPLWRQYVTFAGNALQGDLGISYQRQDKPVTQIILSGFRVTAVLGTLSLALAALMGVTLGVVSALNRNRFQDYAGVLFATVGSAVPGFIMGIFLIFLFGVKLHWLPTFGWDVHSGIVAGWLPRWQQLVLPVFTLSLLPAAYLARVTRASLLDVLQQDYMRTARAKGLSNTAVLWRHAMRNAAIPIITVLGPITATLITGSFIIEQLFSVPGSGRLLVQSITERDYGMIMGTTLFYATIVVLANLAVDITYAFVDPRIRYR